MDNGYSDYNVPRSSKSYGDYDVPLSQKEREARERTAYGGLVPGPRTSDSSPPRQRGSSGEREMDYDVPLLKEERMRREKVASMLATRSRRASDTSTSGESSSRPLSNASSIYSGDASSVSLHSSHSSSKLASHQGGNVEESLLISQSSIDQQLEMIDQLVEDVAAQNSTNMQLLSTSKMQRSLSSGGGNLDGEGSSNSGSNDNLGVWDDICSDSDEEESECMHACMHVGVNCRWEWRRVL